MTIRRFLGCTAIVILMSIAIGAETAKAAYQILRRFAQKLLLRRRWAALLHAAGASPQKAFAAGKIPLPASLRSGLVRQGTRLGPGSRGGRAIPSLQA